MGNTLLSIIGSLIVFLLGLMLFMLRSTRQDIEKLETHVDDHLDTMRTEIMNRVIKPDCIREMTKIQDDVRELFRDMRVVERRDK